MPIPGGDKEGAPKGRRQQLLWLTSLSNKSALNVVARNNNQFSSRACSLSRVSWGEPVLLNHHQLGWLCRAAGGGPAFPSTQASLCRPLPGPPSACSFNSREAGLPENQSQLHRLRRPWPCPASHSLCSVCGIHHRDLPTFQERTHGPQLLRGEVSTSHCKESGRERRHGCGHFGKMESATEAVRESAEERRGYKTVIKRFPDFSGRPSETTVSEG